MVDYKEWWLIIIWRSGKRWVRITHRETAEKKTAIYHTWKKFGWRKKNFGGIHKELPKEKCFVRHVRYFVCVLLIVRRQWYTLSSRIIITQVGYFFECDKCAEIVASVHFLFFISSSDSRWNETRKVGSWVTTNWPLISHFMLGCTQLFFSRIRPPCLTTFLI